MTASKDPRRQFFVLTPEEKKTALFILCAIILGLAAKNYRHAAPSHRIVRVLPLVVTSTAAQPFFPAGLASVR